MVDTMLASELFCEKKKKHQYMIDKGCTIVHHSQLYLHVSGVECHVEHS